MRTLNVDVPPAASPLDLPEFDMTVRVGCSLTYEATGEAHFFLEAKRLYEQALVEAPGRRCPNPLWLGRLSLSYSNYQTTRTRLNELARPIA